MLGIRSAYIWEYNLLCHTDPVDDKLNSDTYVNIVEVVPKSVIHTS